MKNDPLNPKFIIPVDVPGINYNPLSAQYLISEKPIKRGSIVNLGKFERTIKHSEELTILIFPQAGKLRISKGYMEITSNDGLMQFITQLGFSDRKSFLKSVFSTFDTDGYSAKRKLLLHHLYEHTIIPSI